MIYEEKFKDGVKVQDGAILAAEFVNQGKSFRAVRYTHADGYTDYYNDTGYSMRKAFLRTPVNFTRISSGFSLGRKHPVLNTIRAHRGVDYAAPAGTPIKATGAGIVTFSGYKGGYGNVVILRHGEKYSTLYGHMSRFAKGISTGKRIKQGQTIGYVGMTGLATGPHLHYEFHVNGVHRNPLTVELPKALGIPGGIMADFKAKTTPLLSQLDNVITGQAIQTASQGNRLLR
jgi:murein DD-endopeptidase MepM/ murein hydrolase activator NlpD